MGCDIHLYTEKKKTVNSIEQWVNDDNWKVNPYYRSDAEDGERDYEINPMYRDRNYSLFTLLAGVRDYGGQTVAVSEPKGLPDDISNHTKSEAERWDSDGHTHSWLTLGELKRFQSSQPKVVHSGLISRQQADELKNGLTPDSWCQGTNQAGFTRHEWTVENDSLVNIIRPLQEKLNKEYWLHEGEPYDLAKDELIRIVFWFDN